ncbi:MAG: hypothetical protein QHJ73_12105, partial [Armatimonadota bacterium]|nr:hypothetical protein [Armatimonadota bacterium]
MASKWTRCVKRGTLVTPETWEGDRRRTSLNIGEPGRGFVSPDLVLWGDADHGVIVGQDVLPPGAPAQAVAESLQRAIARPAFGGGRPRQPRRIRVSNAEVAEAIRPVVESLGIQLEVTEKLPLLDDVFRSIEVRFGTPANLGYLDATEVPEPLLAEFFAAAAEFRRRCPWRHLEATEPILLECADWVPGHRLVVVF